MYTSTLVLVSVDDTIWLQHNLLMGLFGIPQLSSPEGFRLLQETAVQRTESLIDECCSPDRKRLMVEIFDELSDTLCQVADLAEFIRIAHPESRYSRAAEGACIAVSTLVEKLNTHVDLYQNLRNAAEKGDVSQTTPMDDHVANLFLFDFEQSGIQLPEKKREQVVDLNEYILYLGQRFSAAAHEPRKVDKEKLPYNIRHQFSLDGDNVTIQGLYADAPNELVREAAYKIFLYPSDEQESTLCSLLQSRTRLAQLCGFDSFAHRTLRGTMAETPELVKNFLDKLNSELKSPAARDYNTMRDMKKKTSYSSRDLALWDIPYMTSLAKREVYKEAGENISAYFSLGSCMEGLDFLFQRLYGIRLELNPLKGEILWSPDVYKLDVVHESEGLLGHIYCDFYDRPGKPHQDCHFTIVGGKELADGSYQNPVVVLMLTLPSPAWGTPSLLTPSMADNLFHEMGHAMHSMLARTKYQHVTGTRCSTDLAEVPSVLMEFFASDPRVVSHYAKHYKTGESLPEKQLQAICAAKHTFAAADMQQQVFYSALDQSLHLQPVREGGTTEILASVQQQYYGLPYVPKTAWHHRFSHLVGYGSKYYSYLMSRAVAAWIWQQYFYESPFSRDAGQAYRKGILEHGGSKPARQMVAHFLGKEVNPDSLTQSLMLDLDMRRSALSRFI
nr:EOG090X02LQ [Eulimnadia texana]